MEYIILNGKYGGIGVKYCRSLLNTNVVPDENYLENYCSSSFDINKTYILVFDYTPVIAGDIYIKYPGNVWTKLKLNSKIIHTIMNKITLYKPHISKKANILASIHRSSLTYITI